MEQSSYRVEKPKRCFQVMNEDLELVEESHTPTNLAQKIFENLEVLEAYNLGLLEFMGILESAEIEIKNEIDSLIYQEKFSSVAEWDN